MAVPGPPEPSGGISPSGALGWALEPLGNPLPSPCGSLGSWSCSEPSVTDSDTDTLSSSQERLSAQVSRIKWFVCFNSDFLKVLRNHWAGVEPLSSPEVYNSCYFSPLHSKQEQCPVSVLSVQWLSSGQMLQMFSSKLQILPHRKADCAFGKGIQLDPTVEIMEWEGPLRTAAAFLLAIPYTSCSFEHRISHLWALGSSVPESIQTKILENGVTWKKPKCSFVEDPTFVL